VAYIGSDILRYREAGRVMRDLQAGKLPSGTQGLLRQILNPSISVRHAGNFTQARSLSTGKTYYSRRKFIDLVAGTNLVGILPINAN